ncbi:MAG: hypothetical protein U0573_00315 [Phycisphaerales bacterium]|nr:hypothetical protein [Planctomycetota bacterium]
MAVLAAVAGCTAIIRADGPSNSPAPTPPKTTLAPPQQIFHLKDASWSMEIPPGWRSSPSLLTKLNEELAKHQVAPPDFVLAIVPDDGRPIYAIVQRMPGPPKDCTYEEFEESLGAGAAAVSARSSEVFAEFSKLELGKPSFDRATNRIYIRIKAVGTDGSDSLGFTEGFVTSSATVLVHCYAPVALAEAAMPDFQKIWAGFRSDPLDVFVPGKRKAGISWTAIGVGVIVVMVALMASAAWEKYRERRTEPGHSK